MPETERTGGGMLAKHADPIDSMLIYLDVVES